jgi:hypothetical protein
VNRLRERERERESEPGKVLIHIAFIDYIAQLKNVECSIVRKSTVTNARKYHECSRIAWLGSPNRHMEVSFMMKNLGNERCQANMPTKYHLRDMESHREFPTGKNCEIRNVDAH